MNEVMEIRKVTTMSSREIASLTGKRHDHVMRDIRNMLEQLEKDVPSFGETYIDGMGRKQTQFQLDRIHVECLLTGYSIPLRMKVLERMAELEGRVDLQAQNATPAIPQTYAEALRLAADQAEQLALAAPKVEFVDRYVTADSGSKGFRQVAKLLNANEKTFRAFLSDSKIMYKLGGEWMPYQCHADAGRFEVKGGIADNDHVYNSALFTPKGINWIAGLWAQHCLKVGDTEC